tara:strand:- start:2223 stop:3059 length:837 start_codon:yes stop_codon:yes gene_type:complete
LKKYKYICGNAFKSICKYSIGRYQGPHEHDFSVNVNSLENDNVFVKTEYVANFFHYVDIDHNFNIFTHNSDIPINDEFLKYLNDPRVINWYGQNIDIEHEKLKSVPIGLANPKWAHGNQDKFRECQESALPKENLIYCNFDINTNTTHRLKCLNSLNESVNKHNTLIRMKGGNGGLDNLQFSDYIKELSSCYFCLSPNGNGIDCHKHWECLYLGVIPIVTKSINMNFYKDLPFLILDDWDDLKNLEITEETHKKLWGDFDPSSLEFCNYVNEKGIKWE